MKLSIIWKTAFQSILQNKRRSLLTMLGIVIGIASVITIVAIGNGFKQDTLDRISSGKQDKNIKKISFEAFNAVDSFGNQAMFSENDLGVIRLIPGVESVDFDKSEVEGVKKSSLSFNTATKNITVNYELAKKTEQQLLSGRQIIEKDSIQGNKVVLIDELVAKELYSEPNLALNREFGYKDQLFTIVGITKNTSGEIGSGNYSSLIYFPEKIYETYFGELKSTYMLSLKISTGYDSQQVVKSVLDKLMIQGTMKNIGTYKEYNEQDSINQMGNILNNLTLFISLVAAISLIIGGVGVMNMMYISVSERTKEIGIRRALGGTETDIKSQFLTEGVALTLIGGSMGYILGMIIAYVCSLILPFSVHPDFMTVALAIGISMAIGIIFSYFPASSAAKKDLIDIMK